MIWRRYRRRIARLVGGLISPENVTHNRDWDERDKEDKKQTNDRLAEHNSLGIGAWNKPLEYPDFQGKRKSVCCDPATNGSVLSVFHRPVRRGFPLLTRSTRPVNYHLSVPVRCVAPAAASILLLFASLYSTLADDGPKPSRRQQKPQPPAAPYKGAKSEIYKQLGDIQLRVYLFTPPGHQPTDQRAAAVFFFGGSWNGGSPAQFVPHARYLASRGMVAIVADYRVRSRHQTTPFECVKDGKSCVRWIRSHAKRLGIDPQRIAAGGGSAGGHVAAATGNVPGLEETNADTAVSSRPDALLLFNPVYDNGPGGYGHSRVKDRYQEISPLHNIRANAPPTIVFFGTKDKLVPVATAQKYENKMKAAGNRCETHYFPDQPHGFFNESRSKRSYQETVLFMDRFLISLGYLTGEPTMKVTAEK